MENNEVNTTEAETTDSSDESTSATENEVDTNTESSSGELAGGYGDATSTDGTTEAETTDSSEGAPEAGNTGVTKGPLPVEVAPATPVVAPHADAVATASKFPIPPTPFQAVPPMLFAFCQQIEQHELYAAPGDDQRYPQGTRSFHDKNPGNLKFRNQIGSIGEDKDGFAIFPDYETGFMALVRQVELVISGKSLAYRNPLFDTVLKAWRPMNIADFFKIYDSSYGDNPVAYAADVAEGLSVATDLPLDTLIAA